MRVVPVAFAIACSLVFAASTLLEAPQSGLTGPCAGRIQILQRKIL